MVQQEWIVTVAQEHLHQIDEVVEELESAGLHVERVLRSLGQVTGRTESNSGAQRSPQQALAAVSGVESVATSQRYSVGPPDADIQ